MKTGNIYFWSLLCFFYAFITNAQNTYLRLELERGYTWAHHPFLEGITGTLTRGVSLQYARINPEKNWSQAWNYPETGLEIVWYDFHQPHLGQAWATFYFADFHLNNRRKPFQWIFRTSAGFGYVTNPYDKAANPANVIFGSHFSATFNFALQFRIIKPRWNASVGIGIRHFSNGNFQSPNNGINCPSVSLNFSLPLKPDSLTFRRPQTFKFLSQFNWRIYLRTGINETDVPGMGKFPFFIPGIQFMWRPSYKHQWSTGTELMLNYANKELLRYENIAYNAYPRGTPDFTRAGWFVSHRFMFGKAALNQAVGIYLYNPSGKEAPWYSRLGVEYRIFKRWIVAYSVKLHYFMAEELEWGIMYEL